MKRFTTFSSLVAVFLMAGAAPGGGVGAEESAQGVFTLENGDTNADGVVDVSDAMALVNFLFSGGTPPAPILPSEANVGSIRNGDSNGDGEVDISDVISLLYWLYLGGPPPVPFWAAEVDRESGAVGQGGADGVELRPIEDFVSQQGTLCIPDGMGGCFLRDPPVANFIGWTDPAGALCALIDYAGLADDFAEGAFGTTTHGAVAERPLPDGRAEVVVRLFTRNALTYVFEAITDDQGNFAGCNPVGATVVFGQRAPEALESGEAALGRSYLRFKFINTAPGAPLPDVIQLIFAPAPGQEGPSEVLTASVARGSLPDGRRGLATIVQIVKDGDGDGMADLVLKEDITVRPLGGR